MKAECESLAGKKMNTRRSKKNSPSCLRYSLVVTNCVYVILSAAAVAVVIYLSIDQIGYIKGVLGTDLVVAAAALIIAAGCLLFIFSFIGIVAAVIENPTLLAVYFSFVIVTFFTFVSGAVCLAVYKTWLTEQARYYMEDNIRKVYGINLDNRWNKQVTDSWNRAQASWKCCSVGDQSWAIYQQSEWYKIQPGVRGKDKPYVPSSCCVTNTNGDIEDLTQCQTKQDGPPATELGNQYAGNVNTALYYRGCYEAAKDYVQTNQISWFTIMIGISVGLAIAVLLGLSLAIAMFCIVRRNRDREFITTVTMSSMQQRSKVSLQPDYYMYSVA